MGQAGTVVTVSGGSILTLGDVSYGLQSTSQGTILASDLPITTMGQRSYGAYAIGADTLIDLTNSAISTYGAGAEGMRAEDSAHITATGATIATSGGDASGVVASAATVVLDGGSVTTSGASAHGLSAQDGAGLTASNVTTRVSGSTAAVVQITGGTLTTPTIMTIDGGTLASSQGPLILAQGGTGTIVLQGPIAISARLVGGRPALAMVTNGTTPSNLTLNLTDLGAVSGNVMVTGADNQVNATFKTTDWIGDLIAEPGNMPSITLQDSHWTGQATHASNIRLNAASIWIVTGTSNAVGTITNAGLIEFAPLASGFSTLTTGNYDGQGGHIAFNTALGADNSPTNLLVINGGTATGTTMLSVTNAGGGGDLTVGDGIRLLQAVNGGITQPGAFVLTERVTAGAYEYLLFRGGSSGTEDWFLRSSIDATSIDPHAPGGVIPLYRPEVPLYTPIPAMARHIGLATLGTLHERVGEEMNIRDFTSSGRFGNGAWMRVIGERSNNRWADTAESNVRDADLIGFQAGLDLYRRQHDNGHRDHVGLYAAYTDYRSSSVRGLARGQRNQKVGQLILNGPAVGAYWTHFGPSGWYLDGVIQRNWFDAKAKSFDDTAMSTRGTGLTTSLEGGYPIHLSKRWQIEPQAQIIYQTMSVKDSRDVYSTIGWNESDAVTGRFGGRLQYSAQDGAALWQPYAKVNLWHSFNGTDRASFGASPAIESRFGNTSVELGGGMTARITRTTSLYGHVDHRWSVDGRERRTATQSAIGVRFNW
ncbi:autotransporter outer membrane beta-barrel domain-containing protein [Hephaestia sp. GCM10023244]|uniref:autotransporter family protein n=1 Tax=unclassified Hephaestia TaxID=2631281 RepID=UPI00207716A8|nr:autotransporter outer membrane beta-barrel domain-containing protein [Hephaestia sp. MAHUQ-44]MCM8729762.1 autotransporter outer membrane beta-barrel domain-containing protein [Hephaestia sp. MAHUQ-44]